MLDIKTNVQVADDTISMIAGMAATSVEMIVGNASTMAVTISITAVIICGIASIINSTMAFFCF